MCTEEYDMQWKQGNKCKLKSQQALREEHYKKKNSFMLWNWDGRINDVKGVKIDAECQEPGDLEIRQELK